ncbi:MAG: hypothetical protein LH614_13335 [Pyrinomonadaceae bacterium]|nr:hypothetical protein [Pyrinomonadaceae bacterium]
MKKEIAARSSRHANAKRPTIELTWGETASVNVKDNGRRDNKVAVSPSHPLNCSTLCN